MHFFGSDLRFTRPRCAIERYLAHFDAPEAKFRRRVGEKSVFYLYSKRAASEIRDFAGAGDIIIMLRNPVDTLYSLHSHMLRTGGEEIEDFKAALKDESINSFTVTSLHPTKYIMRRFWNRPWESGGPGDRAKFP